jgi:hypothetical protein
MKDRPFQLTDIVRETSYAIHRYHGCGHLEKVYENALVHRLRKLGLKVEQQRTLTVYDEDGTVIGEISPKTGNGELPKETKKRRKRLPEFGFISFVLFCSFRPSLTSVFRLP